MVVFTIQVPGAVCAHPAGEGVRASEGPRLCCDRFRCCAVGLNWIAEVSKVCSTGHCQQPAEDCGSFVLDMQDPRELAASHSC